MKKYFIIILVLILGILTGYYFRDYQYKQETKKNTKLFDNLYQKYGGKNSQNNPIIH